MPQISVIVPVYNVEKYLGQCVESVLAQSFPDFELLLVDDASTDGSLAAARKYEGDPRVRVLTKPHGGLGDTRNFGVRQAKGKYLVFLDSDDWIEPDMLRNLFAEAEAASAELVLFNFIREDVESGTRRECRLPLNYPESGEEVREKILAELVGPDRSESPWHGAEMLGCAWRRMYLRGWFLANGIRYGDEREIMLEDLPASVLAHCACKRLLVVGGAYYHYRYNPNSLSTRYRPRKMEMLTRCYGTVERILAGRGLAEKYGERHLAWYLRSAAHSSLVNCFSPANPAGFGGRWKEVRGILRNPVLRRAARSDYLRKAAESDRFVLRLLRLGWTLPVYLFYSNYARMLRKNARKR